VTFPGFVDRNSQIQPFGRNIDLFPPERPFTGFDHRVTLTGGRGGNVQLNRIARLVRRFVYLQRHAIRARRAAAFAIILPAITCPETHAADGIVRCFDFQAIGTPGAK
jgi:hypothetical protein